MIQTSIQPRFLSESDYYSYDEALTEILGAQAPGEFLSILIYCLDRGASIRELSTAVIEAFAARCCFDRSQFHYPYYYHSLIEAHEASRYLQPSCSLLPIIQQLWVFVKTAGNYAGPSFKTGIEQASDLRPEGWLERGGRGETQFSDWRSFLATFTAEWREKKNQSEIKQRILKTLLKAPGLHGFSFYCVTDAFSAGHSWLRSEASGPLFLPALASGFFGYSDDDTLLRALESIRLLVSDQALSKLPLFRRSSHRRTLYEGEILEFEKVVCESTEEESIELVRRWLYSQKNLFEIMDAFRLSLAAAIFELSNEGWFSTIPIFNYLGAVDTYCESCSTVKDQIEALYASTIMLKRTLDRNRPRTGIRPENFRMSDNVRNMMDRLICSIESRDLDRAIGGLKYVLKEKGVDRELIDYLIRWVSRNDPQLYHGQDLKFILNLIRSHWFSLSTHKNRYMFTAVKFLCGANRDERMFNQIRNTQRVRIWD